MSSQQDPNAPLQRERKSATRPRPKIEPERQHFRTLVLSNPNYFGNLKDS